MERREFGKTLAGGAVGAAIADGLSTEQAVAQAARAPKPKKNLLMHVGGDYHAVAGGPRADMTAKRTWITICATASSTSPRK